MFDPASTVLTPVFAFAAEGLDMSRYLFACLVVLGLLCLGAFALARLKNSAIVQRAKKRSLRVIDVLPLGRKQRLCVVRAYDRTFVLGVGEREVSLLAEIDQDDELSAEALVQAERDADASKAPRSFAALVQSFAGAALQRRPATIAVPAPVEEPVVAPIAVDTNDVERRAASAARDALLSILDERRAEAAARREQKRAAEKSRAKSERAAAATTAGATHAAPERAPAPKPRTRPAPQPPAPSDGTATAAAPTKTRASWVG